MNAIASRRCHQQHHIEAYQVNSNSYSFFNLLTSDMLIDKVEALLPDHRERIYPPTETLSMFLSQAMSADYCRVRYSFYLYFCFEARPFFWPDSPSLQ